MLMRFVRRRCAVKTSSASLQKVYNPLFSKLNGFLYDIFTTNYDTLLERYFSSIGIVYERGIGKNGIFDPFRLQNTSYHPKIVKLHGSIDLYISPKGIRYSPIVDGKLLDDGTEVDDCMIYPNLIKYLENKPFSVLLDSFEVSLFQAAGCLVIGHSLRDQHIVELLRAVREQRKGFFICVVDPNGHAILNGLPSAMQRSAFAIEQHLEELQASDLVAVTRRIMEYETSS